jgi:tetratricopeptide (TPR) repeat protein
MFTRKIMTLRRLASGLLVFFCLLAPPLGAARVEAAGGSSAEAHAMLEKATAAFALAKYAEAAEFFEKAFELKPDPALLYNAAQAHRLAGNKERALALYQNLLRVYGNKTKRSEVEARIDELKKAIDSDKAVANSPPTSTEPVNGTGPITPLAPPPAGSPSEPGAGASTPLAVPDNPTNVTTAAATTTSAPVLTAQPSASETPLTRKPLFWVAVGGGVAVAVTVILLLTLGGSKDPLPSIGVVR